MGYSQQAHAWYGWKIPTTPEINQWQEDIDYEETKGFFSIDLDGRECVFGVELFCTSNARWEALQGEESFTNEEAEVQFETWKSELTGTMKEIVTSLEEKDDPKFHLFCTFL